jgi:hypothetical protein
MVLMDLQMVRRRFAELETELLWSMWSKDERLPEAEQALRLELIERGALSRGSIHCARGTHLRLRNSEPSFAFTILSRA